MYSSFATQQVSPALPPLHAERLMDQVRERVRYLHFSFRTEEAYLYWIRAFVLFHEKKHPKDMGLQEVEAFLSHLANERHVAAATHKQALSALLFLYGKVLGRELPWMGAIGRPKSSAKLPVVLTPVEVAQVLSALDGRYRLMGQLLYGTGMRLMEGLRLRVKDVDFDRQVLVVREAKGGKDRVVMLPRSLNEALKAQVVRARAVWTHDREMGVAGVEVPDALAVKYPDLGRRWGWFWVFPAPKFSIDPRSRIERRHHLFEERLQRAIKLACATAQIIKPVSVHTLRHSLSRSACTYSALI